MTNEKLKNLLMEDKDFDELFNNLKDDYYIKNYVFKDSTAGYSIYFQEDDKNFTVDTIVNFVNRYSPGFTDDNLIKAINQFVFNMGIASAIWQSIDNFTIDVHFDTSWWHKNILNHIMTLQVAGVSGSGGTFCIEIPISIGEDNNKKHLIIRLFINTHTLDSDYLKNTSIQFWNFSSRKEDCYTVSIDNLNLNFIRNSIRDILNKK